MIARIWRGRTRAEKAAEYLDYDGVEKPTRRELGELSRGGTE